MSKPRSIRRPVIQLVVLCFSFFCALPQSSFSQNIYADSLRGVLPQEPANKHRVYLLSELAWELKREQPDTARALLQEALSLAEQLADLKGKGDAYNYRGVLEDIQGNTELAMTFFEKSLQIRKELGDTKGQTSLYNNLGNGYESLEKYPEALNNYRLARRMRQELGDEKGARRLLYNISIVQENVGNYTEALHAAFEFLEGEIVGQDTSKIAAANNIIGNILNERDRFEEALVYYHTAESLFRGMNDKWGLAGVLQNIGNVQDAFAEKAMDKDSLEGIKVYYDKALDYLNRALLMTEELNDLEGQADNLNNIAAVLKNIGTYFKKSNQPQLAIEEWKTALTYCDRALLLYQKNKNIKGYIQVYNTYGDLYRRLGHYQKALEYAELCLNESINIEDKKFQHNAYKDMARAYYELREYEKAYIFRKKYDKLKYEVTNEAQIKSDERRLAMYSDRLKGYEIEKKQRELELAEERNAREKLKRNAALGGVGALALLALALFSRYRIKNRANRELIQKNKIIEQERKRSDDLLLNILPAATAAELKEKGKASARFYKNVTVLFTDFKSFTSIAEQLSPEDLVSELDTFFQAFDEIISRHNIEKIKTIGDAYMCAGGIPIANDSHAKDVVNAAIEIRDYMDRQLAQKRGTASPVFEIRIGVHTGAVVAGVVGSKKFAYDIWGDAVNVAARMESSGAVGKVNISEQTYEWVKDDFVCTPRGKILAKNKGEVEMYFVERRG